MSAVRAAALRPSQVLGLALGLATLAACESRRPRRTDTSRRLPPALEAPACVPLPGARHGHRVEACTAGLVVLGGSARDASGERGMRDVLMLARDGESWEPRAKMPRGRSHFGSASRGPFAFAIGDSVDRYDAERDEWTEFAPPRSMPRSHFACATLGPHCYVLGGFPAERSGFYRLDLRDGTIEALPPPPGFAPTDHLQIAVVLGERLHVLGGVDAVHTQPRDEHWSFDGTAWRAEPPAPRPVWAKFAAWGVLDDTLVLLESGETMVFSGDRWQTVAPSPPMLAMPASLAIGDSLYVLGGMAMVRDAPAPDLLRYHRELGWTGLSGR